MRTLRWVVVAWLVLAPLAAQSKTPVAIVRSNPAAVAKALYLDWQHGAAKAAKGIADADAVDKLFGVSVGGYNVASLSFSSEE